MFRRKWHVLTLIFILLIVVGCGGNTEELDAARKAAEEAQTQLANAQATAAAAAAAVADAQTAAENAASGNAEDVAAAQATAEAMAEELAKAQKAAEDAMKAAEDAKKAAEDAAASGGGEAAAPVGPLAADSMVACEEVPDIAGLMNRVNGLASPISGHNTPKATQNTVYTPPRETDSTLASPPPQASGVYQVGVFEDATTLNYWAANGPDNTTWNGYLLPQRLQMYVLSDQRLDFVPQVATDLPEPLTEEDGFWVVEIPIRDNITWSDGTPFTANDIAFTANATLKLGLISGNWGQWYDSTFLDRIEAVDDYTAKYYYHTKPGLSRHQWGTLQAPILAAHYWEPVLAEAIAPVEALGEDASEDEVIAAQAAAQDNLFAHQADDEPHAGAYFLDRWEPGAFMEMTANPNYFEAGTDVTQYANGAYADSNGISLYGEAEGDVQLAYGTGPFAEATIYSAYTSQDASLLALQGGEVDVVISPLGLQRGLADRLRGDENIEVVENASNGFRYLSFNNRRKPMNDCAFRQAVAVLIDKEFVTGTILQGVAIPVYSFVPEGNGAWYYDGVPKFGQGLTREERINLAVAILEQAGYSWEGDKKPTWDSEGSYVEAGGRLMLPDGTPVPELDLWAPSASYDPLRSTFAVWTETWLNEAGIPVTANLAGFNALIPRIFTEHDFDMYILGWGLGIFPDYLRDFFAGEQAVEDGNNAGGYVNPEFDALADQLLACEDQADCKEISEQIQLKLSTEVPYVVLFTTPIIEGYRNSAIEYPYTERLDGIQRGHSGGGPLQYRVVVK